MMRKLMTLLRTAPMHKVISRLSKPRNYGLHIESRPQVAASHTAWSWRVLSLVACSVLIACGFAQVPAPDQLTENSARSWWWYAETGNVSIENDTTRVRVGRASLRICTSCPFKTVVFTAPSSGSWNLSAVSAMAFWIYAENPNPAGFQDNSPWIRFYTTRWDYFEFRPNRELMNEARNRWLEIVVPLYPHPNWTVNRVGNPDLRVVRVIAFVTDTWDWNPYCYWLDGLRFLSIESITPNPSTVIGGNSSTGTVTISAPAPTEGFPVQLSSSNPNVATVPASVTIPAGQRTASFTINTSPVASSTQVTITARLGNSSRQATLTVNPRPVEIASVEFYVPNPVLDDDGRQFPLAGRRVNVRITLREPAPRRTEVRLRSSHPSILGTPDRVYFEQGQRTVELSINTNRAHQNTDVTVTASHGDSQRSGRIRLYKAVIRDVRFDPSSVRAGDSFVVTITMAEHIPNGGYYITISNSNRNVVEIRPDVRAREGRQPPISDFRAYTRRGSVSRETSVTITFRGENGEVFRRTIRVRP